MCYRRRDRAARCRCINHIAVYPEYRSLVVRLLSPVRLERRDHLVERVLGDVLVVLLGRHARDVRQVAVALDGLLLGRLCLGVLSGVGGEFCRQPLVLFMSLRSFFGRSMTEPLNVEVPIAEAEPGQERLGTHRRAAARSGACGDAAAARSGSGRSARSSSGWRTWLLRVTCGRARCTPQHLYTGARGGLISEVLQPFQPFHTEARRGQPSSALQSKAPLAP